MLNTHTLDMILQVKSELRLILKTSLVTPDFFHVFYRILSFSTVSQSFKKICVWEVLIISHILLKKGSNRYMDTAVRDLKVVFFKANST